MCRCDNKVPPYGNTKQKIALKVALHVLCCSVHMRPGTALERSLVNVTWEINLWPKNVTLESALGHIYYVTCESILGHLNNVTLESTLGHLNRVTWGSTLQKHSVQLHFASTLESCVF